MVDTDWFGAVIVKTVWLPLPCVLEDITSHGICKKNQLRHGSFPSHNHRFTRQSSEFPWNRPSSYWVSPWLWNPPHAYGVKVSRPCLLHWFLPYSVLEPPGLCMIFARILYLSMVHCWLCLKNRSQWIKIVDYDLKGLKGKITRRSASYPATNLQGNSSSGDKQKSLDNNRRKFRSQTSDNWADEKAQVEESEKRRE